LWEAKLRIPRFIAVTGLALVCALAPAHAEKRVALVIGNDRYANLPPGEQLQKAVNDARTIGDALRSIGFEVIAGENLDRRALNRRLSELNQRIGPGDTAFFFFSGHGVALDGVNYILPADVPNIAAGDEASLLKGEAIGEQAIIAELVSHGARVTVVVLDACRTNPFGRTGGKGIGGSKGLAPPPQVRGVFSLYAASSGQSALDRLYEGDPNPNSVFTRVLAPALAKPGVDLATLALEVREEVARVAAGANHVQRPAYYDETIGGRVYLAGTPPAGGQPAKEPSRGPPVSDAGQAWGIIQNTTSLAVLDDFIRQFGNAPIYGSMARARREELAKQQAKEPAKPAEVQETAAVAPPVKPAVPAGAPCSGPVTVSFASTCAAPLTAAQERGLKPKDTFRECENCPEMVVVPVGAFSMGSLKSEEDRRDGEEPRHVVTVSRPFAVGRLHVTVDQFYAFVSETSYDASSRCYVYEGGTWVERAGRSWRSPGFAQERSHPVVCVNWRDAKAYVDWLAKTTGKPYRLLSEAEWEYAARGQMRPGLYPRFWFGDDEKELCRFGNFLDQRAGKGEAPCNDGFARTSPAGQYTPNAFGLYDMFGNAWQWTADCWHSGYNGAPADGSAWTIGCQDNSGRVIRGGAWNDDPWALRAAARHMGSAAGGNLGIRVGRTLTP
jgi:formylglycine-generating enzyme required for sulfatase activity